MGQVIQIADATRVASGDAAITFIDECYARLSKLPGFIVRPEQRQLSRELCRALVADEPIAAEAPTGTGKTLAYLIGAIAAAEKLRVSKDIPIVVATATVGLQSQILYGDLPKLFDAGILNEREAVLAKGRSRYFCVANAERFVEGKSSSGQFDFFDTDANTNVVAQEEIKEMLESWYGHAWAGDFDSYTGMPPSALKNVQASADTCLGHKCDHYSSCPFFNARRALSSARIIVANHDLVLSDLAMAKSGIDPLFPGQRYLVVFDEAHHLPDKALDIGTAHVKLGEALAELPKLAAYTKAWHKSIDLIRLMGKARLSDGDFDHSYLVNALQAVRDEVLALDVDPDSHQYRFVGGALTPGLDMACKQALGHAMALEKAIQESTQALKGSNLGEKFPELKPVLSELLFLSAFYNSLLGNLTKGLSLFVGVHRAVRWAFHYEGEASLHTCPLEGADVLKDLLWGNPRAIVGMVSATLKDFEGFDRFKHRSGAGESLRTLALPHIFPYRENKLQVVAMKHSPRYEEKERFVQELTSLMPRFIDANEGTLVLFPSRSLMRQLLPSLRKTFGNAVLAQGDMGIKELISAHRARIDRKEGSILCGLATLAEGLDLPGAYCTHVLICSLPFTVPTTPIERELQEHMGKEYFAQRALPDALVKMTQMVGRLMRRESDRGRITVFDKRLIYTRWGLKMLNALPPFTRKVLSVEEPRAPKT